MIHRKLAPQVVSRWNAGEKHAVLRQGQRPTGEIERINQLYSFGLCTVENLESRGDAYSLTCRQPTSSVQQDAVGIDHHG